METKEPNIEVETFLTGANKFHLEARYPEYKTEFYKTCSKEYAQQNFDKIKEIFQWLKSLLN